MRIVLTIDIPAECLPNLAETAAEFDYANVHAFVAGAVVNELDDAGAYDFDVAVTSVQP